MPTDIECSNDPCERPATQYFLASDGSKTPLCELCADAYRMGQAHAADPLFDLDTADDEGDTICPECKVAFLQTSIEDPDNMTCPKCGSTFTPDELEKLANEPDDSMEEPDAE